MIEDLTLADFNILLEAKLDRMRMEEENLIHQAYRIALLNNTKNATKEYKKMLEPYQDKIVEHAPIDKERNREMSALIDSLKEVD